QRPHQGGEHLLLEDGVEGERRLRLRVAERDADVVPVADRLERQVTLPGRPLPLLRAGELELAFFTQVVIDGVLKTVEDRSGQYVHAEEAEIHAVQQARLL